MVFLGDNQSSPILDGVSIWPLLQGNTLTNRALFWHFPAYLEIYKNDRAFEDAQGKPHFRTTPVSVIREDQRGSQRSHSWWSGTGRQSDQ